MTKHFVLLFILILHFILSVISTRMIIKSYLLDSTKKKINIILTWTIPFLWFLIVRSITKVSSGTMTKDKRKIDKSSFYESGIGETI